MSVKQTIGKLVTKASPLSTETVEILRLEMNAWRIRMGCRFNPVKIATIKRLVKQDDISLNMGAGPFGEEGWVNVDMFKTTNISFTYDCRTRLPFRDGSVARIRCEHLLEHLDRHTEADSLLKNFYRILKKGGVLRLIVPHAPRYMKAYIEGTAEAWATLDVTMPEFSDNWLPMDVMNHIFRQAGEHKFAYDVATMKISLQKAGFTNIIESDYAQSSDPLLRNDLVNHRYRSLYFECIK